MTVRGEHPCWGGRKIQRVLERQGLTGVPAPATITEIVRRHGALNGPGAGERRDWVRFEHAEPNDLWQMDFKGWFELGRGRCHPLTVLDDHSRYALEIGACGDETGETVRAPGWRRCSAATAGPGAFCATMARPGERRAMARTARSASG